MEEILEEWRVVKNHSDFMVSNLGNIKYIKTNSIIYQNNYSGYLFVNLSTEIGKDIKKGMHRLVAEAFLQNPENKKYVSHVDKDRSNNNVNNLKFINKVIKIVKKRKTYTTNKSGIRGVYFNNNRWKTAITVNGKRISKSFTVNKYGDQAKQMAIDKRK